MILFSLSYVVISGFTLCLNSSRSVHSLSLPKSLEIGIVKHHTALYLYVYVHACVCMSQFLGMEGFISLLKYFKFLGGVGLLFLVTGLYASVSVSIRYCMLIYLGNGYICSLITTLM